MSDTLMTLWEIAISLVSIMEKQQGLLRVGHTSKPTKNNKLRFRRAGNPKELLFQSKSLHHSVVMAIIRDE